MKMFEDIKITGFDDETPDHGTWHPRVERTCRCQLSYDPPNKWTEIFNGELRYALGYGFKLSQKGIKKWWKGLSISVSVRNNQMTLKGNKRRIDKFREVADRCINRTNQKYRKHQLDNVDRYYDERRRNDDRDRRPPDQESRRR